VKRIDAFMFRDELDLLECRLATLDDAVDYFVLVEAGVTHGHNRPKPLVYLEHQERFDAWSDRIIHVVADELPDDPDAWSREHAQREYIWQGLAEIGAGPDDILLQSDVDEIPDPDVARYIAPTGRVRFEQTLYCFAVDWQHPAPWYGTVAAKVKDIDSMAGMRDARLLSTHTMPLAGWHFSWLGGPDAARAKMDSFCHPEIEPQWGDRLAECYERGIHVDGTKLLPVDVDDTYPEWMQANVPAAWLRPRGATGA